MGNLSTILAAILCASAPMGAEEAKEEQKIEVSKSSYILGKDTISALRTGYENGKYNEFLSEMDADYQKAAKANELEGLVEMRKKEIPTDFQESWEVKFTDLQKQKNSDLLAVLSDKDDSAFAEKVRSLAANLSSPEQEKAITKLQSFVQMAPKSGSNDDENMLIDIDVEYEYKLLHAVMPTSNISHQERLNYQTILRMEKMDKMVKASKNFQDHSLKQAVGLAAANLDARLARNLDGMDLNAFVKGKMKPANETEEKVFEILSSYQGQFSDLMKNVAEANH